MHPIQRQGPHDLTIPLPSSFKGVLKRGEVVRVFGSDFGMVVTPSSTGGDSVAVQLDGFLLGLPMIRDADGNPLITSPGMPPTVHLETVRTGQLERVTTDIAAPSAKMTGRILHVEDGIGFAWAPNLGAAADGGGGVTQADLNAATTQLYQSIMGGSLPENLNSLRELVDDYNAAIASKQDASDNLDTYSATTPTPLALQILQAEDENEVRTLIGASAEPVEGAYATSEDVEDARVSARDEAVSIVRGGVTTEYDTLAKLADAIAAQQSDNDAQFAAKQDSSPNLTELAAVNPGEFGKTLLATAIAADALTALGAQPAIAAGTYATPAEVTAARDAAVELIRGGVSPDWDTLAKAKQAYTDLVGMAPETLDTLQEIAAQIIENEDAIGALTAAIAGKQDVSAVLTAIATGYSAGANQVVAPGSSVPAFTYNAGGGGYQLNPIAFTAYGRNLAQLAPVANTAVYTTDANGTLATMSVGALGRAHLAMVGGTADRMYYTNSTGTAFLSQPTTSVGRSLLNTVSTLNSIPYMDGAGSFALTSIGNFGRFSLGINQPGAGAMVYCADAFGSAATVPTVAGGRSLLNVAAANDSIIYFNNVGTPVTTAITASSRSLLGANLLTGGMFYGTGGGAVAQLTSTTAGRNMLGFNHSAAFPSIPIFGTDGTVTAQLTSAWSRNALNALPGTGQIPYATDASGNIGYVTTTTYSRSFMQAATAQAARTLAGEKAAIVSNFNNNTAVPANTPTELQWVNTTTVEGFDAADVSISGGRVTTAQTTSIAAKAILSLYASAPGDFAVTLELRSADGATIGNENGAPGQGTGAGWKTVNVPFRVAFAGYWSIVLPDLPMKAGGNFAQLRVSLTTPAGAAAVNVSEYQLKLMQNA